MSSSSKEPLSSPNGDGAPSSGGNEGFGQLASAHPLHALDVRQGVAFARPAYGDRAGLSHVLEQGKGTVRVGILVALLVAAGPHVFASVRALTSLFDMLHWVEESRSSIHEYFWTQYEIEVPKEEVKQPPPEEPPPPPPPPPIPEQVAAAPPPKIDDPYKDSPPPAAAKAAAVQTAKDDSQEPLSFPGAMTNGDGNAGYGAQSGNGTGDKPVTTPGAKATGTPGGTGTGTAPQAAAPDRSKPPTLVGSTSWNCPFPPEADAEGRDSATATIVVTVRPDGSPQNVSIVADPGSGFGRAARACALTRRYQAGLDRDGKATTASTPPIRVRFSR